MPRRPATANTRETTRLDASAWIEAALDVLAANGVDGVRVEPLAKQLGVTKGSFYWHFKDRPALLDAMLETWRQNATLAVIERLEKSKETPASRIRFLLELPFYSPRAPKGAMLELSVRIWSKMDKRAARAVEEVDRQRLTYLAGLLRAHGLSEALSHQRAYLIYAYVMGEATITIDRDKHNVKIEQFLLRTD
jgi:AcrR family transcriptional regulator